MIQSIIAVGPSADRDKIIAKIKGKVIYCECQAFENRLYGDTIEGMRAQKAY